MSRGRGSGNTLAQTQDGQRESMSSHRTQDRHFTDDTRLDTCQQFEYGFDDIGNRKTAGSCGDQNGGDLTNATYWAYNMDQCSRRDASGELSNPWPPNSKATVMLSGSAG